MPLQSFIMLTGKLLSRLLLGSYQDLLVMREPHRATLLVNIDQLLLLLLRSSCSVKRYLGEILQGCVCCYFSVFTSFITRRRLHRRRFRCRSRALFVRVGRQSRCPWCLIIHHVIQLCIRHSLTLFSYVVCSDLRQLLLLSIFRGRTSLNLVSLGAVEAVVSV